ncbi:MgtC/SapB family protein [Actinophytocola oryzae]|uniref:Putative Mg2+ transporter-C (MgtC) family protein n=1 Tax=Actinophytocola oryzae TaxID=502181 RepID=A0A4R7US74_9PSEU|nr:MgtC/SapB family protein [Actinophytocola oryzae]TDV34216.1 putative Mg2+ transporter-C (MgtC) family protein [Actinophytocola oryzae]
MTSLTDSAGQGWTQVFELGLALVLSAAIGLEREIRQKSAGLRTHSLVGLGAALFMVVSKYGFVDVLGDHVTLDPSRIAAQIVSGIGFIGGGLIFVRRDAVRGLTTAAVVWLTTAVGMAAGAGLWLLAIVVTAGHFVVVFGFTPLAARLPRSKYAQSTIRLSYLDGRGVLRQVLTECTRRDFTVGDLSVDQDDGDKRGSRTVTVWLSLRGSGAISALTAALADIDGILTATSVDANSGEV